MGRSYGKLFWERIDRYPPVLCRLLARIPKGRPLTNAEVSSRSGLSPAQVEAISRQVDWRGIDLPTARAFMVGCGTDLSNRAHCKRIWVYLRTQPKSASAKFSHLRKDRNWETHWLPLIELFFNHIKSKYGSNRSQVRPQQELQAERQ